MIKNKYRHSDRDAKLEAEIAELEKVNQPEVTPPAAPAGSGEETWQKRYSDLRKHQQKREDEMKAELDEVRRQLAAATQKEMKFPKTEAEIADWATKYPDVAKIVDTYAMKRAKEMSDQLETRLKEIDEKDLQATRRRAYLQLLDAHPDFEDIADSQEFQEWVDAQPKYIYDALYVNDTDAPAAIRAVDLYKADTNKTKKLKAPEVDVKDAARTVRTPASGAPTLPDDKVWSESKMKKLSNRDLEKFMPEIDEAIRTGKFVYDESGAY